MAHTLPLVVAKFFFWNSGTTMQMSVQGLLRTLLCQAANKCKILVPSLFPKRWHYHKRYGDDFHPWTCQNYRKAFEALLQEDRKSIRLCFFIDGLDEFSGDHTDLVSIIKKFVLTTIKGEILHIQQTLGMFRRCLWPRYSPVPRETYIS